MPSAVTLIRSSAMPNVAEHAYAATAPRDARLIFLAGICPLDAEGTTVAPGEHDAPSTLVGVTVLGYDGQLVEIEAVAAIVDKDERPSHAVKPATATISITEQSAGTASIGGRVTRQNPA